MISDELAPPREGTPSKVSDVRLKDLRIEVSFQCLLLEVSLQCVLFMEVRQK